MNYFFRLLFLLNILFFIKSTVYAVKVDDTQKYSVNDLKIQATSTDPVKAKDEALRIGLRKALKIVFKNLEIDESNTEFMTDSTISDIVSSVRIYDEIITKNSYTSYIVVIFDKNFLEYNLSLLDIKPKKTTTQVFLYIPLFDYGNDNIELLDTSNIWYSTAYDKFFEQTSDKIFIIDNYSLSNSGLISWDKIINKDYDSFSTLLKKYNSNTVVVSIAKYNKEQDRVDVKLIEINAENKITRTLNYINKNDYEPDKLIEKASEETFNFIVNLANENIEFSKDKKNNKEVVNIKKFDTKGKNLYIDVLMSVNRLDNFIYVKNLLKNLDFINNVQTIETTTKLIKLRIYHKCEEMELIEKFRRKNFILDINEDQYLLNYIGA